VRRHLLRVLEGTAIGQVGRDTCRAEAVIADRRVNAGRVDTGPQCFDERVMAGRYMALATFFVKPQLSADAFGVEGPPFILERRIYPRKRIGQRGDERPIPESTKGVRRYRVEQLAPLLDIRHGRLAGFHHALRSTCDRGRVHRHDLASD
jgi:hypothetical protein